MPARSVPGPAGPLRDVVYLATRAAPVPPGEPAGLTTQILLAANGSGKRQFMRLSSDDARKSS